jgi:hypothetical protein
MLRTVLRIDLTTEITVTQDSDPVQLQLKKKEAVLSDGLLSSHLIYSPIPTSSNPYLAGSFAMRPAAIIIGT